MDDRRLVQHYDRRPMADRSPQALGWLALDDLRWDRGIAMPHHHPPRRRGSMPICPGNGRVRGGVPGVGAVGGERGSVRPDGGSTVGDGRGRR
jgi:hypothetical protein